MYENYYAVIMAGGSGTRLWPLSRSNQPKQSLAIGSDRSLFQQAVDRLNGLFPAERILIVTVADQIDLLSQECPEIPLKNFIIEPMPRGTASVVGLAAIAINARSSDATMAILTADHLIQNEDHLRSLLKAAHQVAQERFLVTLGILPTYPATGYGYIQKGDLLGKYKGLDAYHVLRFKEKPNQDLANQLSSDGEHVWNSGMFIWQVNTVLDAFSRQMPELYSILDQIGASWSTDHGAQTLESLWPTIQPQTIDYGIMENAQKVAIIPAPDLGWSDVGSWESLFDALSGDESGNIFLRGESVALDTRGTLICEDSPDRLIVTIGVEDLVIIDSGNTVLVCDRKQAQQVRDVVNHLKQSGREEYL